MKELANFKLGYITCKHIVNSDGWEKAYGHHRNNLKTFEALKDDENFYSGIFTNEYFEGYEFALALLA